MKITKKAKLKLVCPNKCHIELQMFIVVPSAPILQNPVCVQWSRLCDESRSFGGRRWAPLTIKPVACCVVLRNEVVNDATGVSVRADRIEKRLCGLDNCYRCKKKRCTWLFERVNIRYQLPEVLAVSGIKPPGLTDRRKGGTGEPAPVEYAQVGKPVCSMSQNVQPV